MSGAEIVEAVKAVSWCIFGCNLVWAFCWCFVGICDALEGGR